MGEPRGSDVDRPESGASTEAPLRPVDWSSEASRRRIGVEIQRLTVLGDERAADPSKRVYDPLDHLPPVSAARHRAVLAAAEVADARSERPAWRLDRPVTDDRTARDVLRAYCGGDLAPEDAKALADHIASNKATKPILAVVEGADPLVQKVYVDQVRAGGHHAERHDCWRDDLAQAERARMRLDPAHTEEELAYWRGADAIEGVDRFHFCAPHATRIHDPVAFVVATARVLEHPKVKAALAEPFDPSRRPDRIEDITIEDVLGADGHLSCSGFRLVGEDIDQAREDRRAFMQAVRAEMPKDHSSDPVEDHRRAAEKVHREEGKPVPEVDVIPSFLGGTMSVAFQPKADGSGYEVNSFYPLPPEPQGEQ